MTLLEFLVAIAVSAVVMTLALTVFTGMFRGFLSQTKLARTAGDMFVAKKRIDACLSDIVSIRECSEKSVTCVKAGGDGLVVIKLAKDSLCAGSAGVCGNLRDFAFTLMQKDPMGPWVLLWEGRLKKGDWFGGVVSGGG